MKEAKEIIDFPPEQIVWCYAKHQPALLEELLKISKNIIYIHGLPSHIEKMFDRKTINMIIIDDMIDEVTKDKRISK